MVDLELHDEVVELMDSLDEAAWDRAVVVIDRLIALGSAARMPLSKSLGDGLFELRFTLGPTARRITYRFTKDGRIILLPQATQQRVEQDFSTSFSTARVGTRRHGPVRDVTQRHGRRAGRSMTSAENVTRAAERTCGTI